MKALLAAASLLAALAISPIALAQPAHETIHRVGADDTLELLAAEYYGSRHHAALIRLANQLDGPRALRRGERLRIPLGLRIVTEAGDSLETIADQQLGDPRRAELLAEYNDIAPVASLAAGVLLRIPFHVELTASESQSLGVLAARYLGGARDAELLRAYNFLEDDVESIDAGDSILIPAPHIAVRASRLPRLGEPASARVKARRAAQADAASALPAVRHAWRHGDFELVERHIAPLDLDYIDTAIALELSLILGGAHLARGDTEAAKTVFQAALSRDPGHEMSAYHFSPAIREVWKQYGGLIDTSSR